MMRILIVTLLTVVISAGSALAQTPPPTQQTPPPVQTPPQTQPAPPAPVPFPPDVKIGFVNFQTLVDSSALGKQGMQKLQALAETKQAEIGVIDKQVQALQQEIQTQASVLTQQALAQKNAELQKLQGQMQLAQQNAQTEYELLQNQLLDDFESKALPIIEAIRAERGLWFILAIQDGGGLAVVAAQQGLNLTPEVARRMDAAQGSGG